MVAERPSLLLEEEYRRIPDALARLEQRFPKHAIPRMVVEVSTH